MLKRGGQIVAGIFANLVGAVIVIGPILRFNEQPSTTGYIAGGCFIALGMWWLFPVGLGQFGDWIAAKVPFLHDHGKDDEATE